MQLVNKGLLLYKASIARACVYIYVRLCLAYSLRSLFIQVLTVESKIQTLKEKPQTHTYKSHKETHKHTKTHTYTHVLKEKKEHCKQNT